MLDVIPKLLGIFVMVTVSWVFLLILLLQFHPDQRRRETKLKDLFLVGLIMGIVTVGLCALGYLSESKAEDNETLGRKIEIIQERVVTETEFGKEMAEFIKAQNTTYVLKEDLPTEGYYMVAEDQIFYKPFPLQKRKKLLLLGKPIRIMRNFHEEIHRAQQRLCKWQPFLQFFREHGEIKQIPGRYGRGRLMFDFKGGVPLLAEFARNTLRFRFTSEEELTGQIGDYIGRYTRGTGQTVIIRELQAHLSCECPSPDDLYEIFIGTDAPYRVRMEKPFFEELFMKMYGLYGHYDGDHAKVAKFVGDTESLTGFVERANRLWGKKSADELERDAQAFAERKLRFYDQVTKIAKEYF